MTAWIDPWRAATVALGQVRSRHQQKPRSRRANPHTQFSMVGSGVIFGLGNDPTKTPWLVTAKHVFSDPDEGWRPKSLHLRFSWFAEDNLGPSIELWRHGRRRWIPHPDRDVDLACVPLDLGRDQTGRAKLPRITAKEFAPVKEIYEGASVAILGYPGAVGHRFWSHALVRQGMISWVSPGAPGSEVFLVDSNMFPGNSGGPVFKLPAGTDREGRFAVHDEVAFLGIVSQARIQMMALIAGGKELEVHFKKKKKPEPLLIPSFVALGIVEPAFRVKQLLIAAAKSCRRITTKEQAHVRA